MTADPAAKPSPSPVNSASPAENSATPAPAAAEPVNYVILWEQEARFVSEVQAALNEIDPKLFFVHVTKQDDYEKALAGTLKDLPPGSKVRVVILPVEVKVALPLQYPVIMTSYEHTEALVRLWAPKGVFNLLYKPYDPLLLKQHLRLALSEGKPASEFDVHDLKTTAAIEMLKSVPMEALSEVGFITRSERDVPMGRVSKFYGKVFEWNHLISAYARICQQKPHAKSPNEKSVYLTWFGVSREQLLQIRGRFPKKPELKLPWGSPSAPTPTPTPAKEVNLLILGDPSPAGAELSGTFERNYPKARVQVFKEVPDAKAPLNTPFTAIFVHKDLIDIVDKDPRFKDVPRIVLITKTPPDEEFRVLAGKAMDVEMIPPERVSLLKKISVLLPDLQPTEAIDIKTYEWIETLEVGQPVEISEINETGLSMRYERTLPIGTVRRFVLWQPMEAGLPMLTARCYFSEPEAGKEKSFINHFTFFGMADHEIKHVRLWMRDNYIMSKQKG